MVHRVALQHRQTVLTLARTAERAIRVHRDPAAPSARVHTLARPPVLYSTRRTHPLIHIVPSSLHPRTYPTSFHDAHAPRQRFASQMRTMPQRPVEAVAATRTPFAA